MILGWSPTVNGTTAIPGVDNSASGAVYKGLTTMSDRLYATDFHNGRVDVFDASFKPVTTATFTDPKLPKGYAPFGIQALAGSIFVTYAKQDAREEGRRRRATGSATSTSSRRTASSSRASRPAAGRTRRRTRRGALPLRRRASACSRATSSSATSATAASARTRIAAAASGSSRASCATATRRSSRSTGLWAIAFGNGAAGGPTTSLYFAAGPGGEAHGLFGSITAG